MHSGRFYPRASVQNSVPQAHIRKEVIPMKKFLAVAMAATLAVSALTGCGDKSANTDKEGSANGENVLVIGGIGPLTGSTATYGKAVMNGAKLAVDEINAAGGVNGMTLELDFQDDENDSEKAITAYNTLKDNGMKLLMGTVTSTPCTAVAAKSIGDRIFQLTPSGSAVECIQNDNAFRVCFSDPNQGSASAQYIAEHGLASKVAVIYDSSDVYSSGIYETFTAEAQAENLEIVTAQAFTADSKTDFAVQLQKIKDSGAELVFLPIYYQEAALILTQASKLGLDVEYFGCDGLDGVIPQLGSDAALADGVMLLTPFAADAADEKTVQFTTAFKAAYNNEIPNQFAADAYDAIYAIKAALEDAGVTDASISAEELCDKMIESMTKITLDGVTGSMTWDASGEPTKDPKAMVIQDGAYKAM